MRINGQICYIHSKRHDFPVPVSENETEKFYFLFPYFETENVFSEICSRKTGNYFKIRELFGKPETFLLSIMLSTPHHALSLTHTRTHTHTHTHTHTTYQSFDHSNYLFFSLSLSLSFFLSVCPSRCLTISVCLSVCTREV